MPQQAAFSMSLFTTREWWSSTIDSAEEFDKGCMCVANIDNEPAKAMGSASALSSDANAKIIIGSFSGLLRIYYPRQAQYRIEDLMIEQNLGMPILQVAAGRFVSGSNNIALAVLHPRRLTVYKVGAMGGQGSSASYYSMVKVYEHILGEGGEHFTAFNFCCGPFGNANTDKDFICVQSMDGQLQFFEQDHLAFIHRIDEVLIPGPLCYSPQLDAIVIATTNMNVACYKYHVLAARSSSKAGGGNDKRKDFESLHGSDERRRRRSESAHEDDAQEISEWSLNIGEHAHDIYIGRYSAGLAPGMLDVMVVGEHSLFCLSEQGAIRFQKRLAYDVAATIAYSRDGSPSAYNSGGGSGNISSNSLTAEQNLIITTHTGRLLVYGKGSLLWAAKLGFTPVAVAVAQFGKISGLVVALDEKGAINVVYMGTEPPTTAVATGESEKLDFEAMEKEHQQLLKDIRVAELAQHSREKEAGGSSSLEGQASDAQTDHVLLRAQVPLAPDILTQDEMIDLVELVETGKIAPGGTRGVVNIDDPSSVPIQVTVRVALSYVASASALPIRNVALSIHSVFPIITLEPSVVVPMLRGGTTTPMIVPLKFYVAPGVIPSCLDVQIIASYNTSDTNQPRVSHLSFKLPTCLCLRVALPTKDDTCKCTLDTDRDPVSLVSLFDDMLQLPGVKPHVRSKLTGMGANVIAFRSFSDGNVVTVLGSKNAGRYRVQSTSYASLWLTMAELILRLRLHFNCTSPEQKLVSCADSIPLREMFNSIEDHFAARVRLRETEATLNDRAQQFRVIQKRLLVRFKSKNPAPLNNMDTLLRGTYQSLQELGTLAKQTEKELAMSKGRLQVSNCFSYLCAFSVQTLFVLTIATTSHLLVMDITLSPNKVHDGDHTIAYALAI